MFVHFGSRPQVFSIHRRRRQGEASRAQCSFTQHSTAGLRLVPAIHRNWIVSQSYPAVVNTWSFYQTRPHDLLTVTSTIRNATQWRVLSPSSQTTKMPPVSKHSSSFYKNNKISKRSCQPKAVISTEIQVYKSDLPHSTKATSTSYIRGTVASEKRVPRVEFTESSSQSLVCRVEFVELYLAGLISSIFSLLFMRFCVDVLISFVWIYVSGDLGIWVSEYVNIWKSWYLVAFGYVDMRISGYLYTSVNI